MNQQTIAPVAKRSPLLPLAVGLLAAVAYGAGIATVFITSSSTQGPAAGPNTTVTTGANPAAAPHRVVPGPNEY
jgi:hypothetical protein